MIMNLTEARNSLAAFDFARLFIEVLGWMQPSGGQEIAGTAKDTEFNGTMIARLGGIAVFEIHTPAGIIPGTETRKAIHDEIVPSYHENLLIFVDSLRSQSAWHWEKRLEGKDYVREHFYMRGQPGDLFLSKLSSMAIDIGDYETPDKVPLLEITSRVKDALDVECVIKRFYEEFQEQHQAFLDNITGIDDQRDKKWYVSVMLNRLMFIYFLQRKHFIDNGDIIYLQNKLAQMQKIGPNLYYEKFLKLLFFEGFAKPEEKRSPEAKALLGKIKYLNGGLFLPHPIEQEYREIAVADAAFENLFSLFKRYSWNLNDTPGGDDNEMNPDVLGYIFEKYINQKALGAYYTRTEITGYLCERTIHQLVLDRVNNPGIPGVLKARHFNDIGELLLNLDAGLCMELLEKILPNLRLLDPACGSAAFLVAAMKTLINIYAAVIGRIKFLTHKGLTLKLKEIEKKHPSVNYYIKKAIITDNLYGVDIMEEAVEIAKLRLFLALVAAAGTIDDLEPLPNIDFNILPGNSLVGLMKVDDEAFNKNRQESLFRKSYRQVLEEKNRLVDTYRHATAYAEDLQTLRDHIAGQRDQAGETLNSILCDYFNEFKIKYEQAAWDEKKNQPAKTEKRPLRESDIKKLKPFHWGFEFSEIINGSNGGFDIIITNPPWEIFKPNAKEFFEEYSDLVTKKKMTIKEFEKIQPILLKEPETRRAWLEYQGSYPHVSAFYRNTPQYKNQVSIVDGKKAGTDINLYKLFTEQCYNLLKEGGYCGMVIPSGIYTDLGAKQLREMLFNQTRITGLFCFENRKGIFESVHRSFKFVVLTFEKGGKTNEFPAAFMRHEASELERFPREGSIGISIESIRRLSPESLSVVEFKNKTDIEINKKMFQFPLVGATIPGKWNLRLTNEFHMTNDSHLFKTTPGKNRLPLNEGKMFHQYDSRWGTPKYWLVEGEARKALLGSEKDTGRLLDYQHYRLAFRDIAASTNERAMIMTILPKNVFCPHTVSLENVNESKLTPADRLVVLAFMNSFAVDYLIRQRVTSHLSFYFINNLPVPRLTEEDTDYMPIVERAARLICTVPEYDDLAKEIFGPGATSAAAGVADADERVQLRAELDGIIAHIYGLTQEEFAYILTTFPLVDPREKTASLDAYRHFTPDPVNREIIALIAGGESQTLEFKSTARWDLRENRVNKNLEQAVVKTTAAFLNTEGGTLLIGVSDEGQILGLHQDYKTLGKKPNRDGFENWLTTLLLDNLGKDISPFIRVAFYTPGGKDICQVEVTPATKPVYIEDGTSDNFYIRAGNTSRQLNTREAVEYILQKWPG